MWLHKVHHHLERTTKGISRVVNSAGVSVLLVMMVLVTTDVILRYVFNSPLRGAYEIVEVILVIVVSFGLAYTAMQKGMVAVEVLVERYPPRVRVIVDIFNSFAGLAFFSLISWKTAEQAMTYRAAGETTYVSALPLYPFALVVSFGMALLSLVLFIQLLESITGAVRK
jgi:TRAP-type C4-dicarboxylate transport system permease small subunit